MEYKRVIQEFPNGTNINLIPILTPEEEEKRHQRLNDAAVRLLLAQEKKDMEKQMKVATQEVAEGQAMRVIIENYSRVPLPVAVLMVFLKLNGNSDKEKERHVVIEKQEKIDGTIFTIVSNDL